MCDFDLMGQRCDRRTDLSTFLVRLDVILEKTDASLRIRTFKIIYYYSEIESLTYEFIDFKNSEGVFPVCSLNCLLKVDLELKPHW